MVSILAGAVLLWRIKSQFYALKKEHRIVEHIATHGDILQPEYRGPRLNVRTRNGGTCTIR